MNATLASALVLGSILAAPARLPYEPKQELDIAQECLDQIHRDGRAIFALADGRIIEIGAKHVHGRKLIDVTILFRNSSGDGYEAIAHAKEAELLVDTARERGALIETWQCNTVERNGSVGYVESKIWVAQSPPGLGSGSTKIRAIDLTRPEPK